MRSILAEMMRHGQRTLRVAWYEIKAQDKETFFGAFWNLLNPLLQVLVYWFVFSVALNVQLSDSRFPYAIWLVTGLLPWMNINSCIQSSAGAVFSFARIIKNMRIPLSMIPLRAVLMAEIKHLATMGILLISLWLLGVPPMLENLWLVYYVMAEMVFLLGMALLTSSISVIFQDFQRILSHGMRLLFYISSVTWPIERLPQKLQWVLRLNPLAYIIEGYRNCLLYGEAVPLMQTIYFWAMTILIFYLGSRLYLRIQDRLIDVL